MNFVESAKRVILETGEGAHSHTVNSTIDIDFTHTGEATIRFELKDKAVVTHEEHDRIVLNEGVYYKTSQVEFNPFDGTISNVFD